jgi:hypothetical protein
MTLNRDEKYKMFNPVRYCAAALIATGGTMHLVGLVMGLMDNQVFPAWYWMIFLVAIPGYLISSILILKNIRAGYYFAFISPIIGGLLILGGFLFPASGLLILIPGTYHDEIRLIGFITLISEPVASLGSLYLIRNEIWNIGK